MLAGVQSLVVSLRVNPPYRRNNLDSYLRLVSYRIVSYRIVSYRIASWSTHPVGPTYMEEVFKSTTRTVPNSP